MFLEPLLGDGMDMFGEEYLIQVLLVLLVELVLVVLLV
jgi:hypothetical protein